MPTESNAFTDSVWLRPPKTRAGQPTLTREQIIRAAIELLDAEGAAGLSMRRLGAKLGAGATSIYWYVQNKDELLELAVDEVMGEVYVPEVADTPWRIGVSVMATGMRSMLLRHPWVIGRLGLRPNLGPNAMRMGERSLAALTAAGFTGIEIAHVSALLTAHAIGSATTVSAVITSTRAAGVPVVDIVKTLEPHLRRVAADHPAYERWYEETRVSDMDPAAVWDESFMFGLERILDGLEAWLTDRTLT